MPLLIATKSAVFLEKRRRFAIAQSLMKNTDRTVYRNEDGDWVNKRNDADKASSLHATQREANDAAREMLRNQGGGELTTMGIHGVIVSKDTIAPGNESSTRDTEH